MTSALLILGALVRRAFWAQFSPDGYKPRQYWGKSQNELPADVRCAFVDFVDMLAREGTISERLAQSVTLDTCPKTHDHTKHGCRYIGLDMWDCGALDV